MNLQKKWLFILFGIVVIGSIFAEKIVKFYFDWIWFTNHQIDSVFWTIILSQWGFGLATGVFFFIFTCFPLKRIFDRSSHMPVLLSDTVRRELPLLDFLAGNLKKLMFFGPYCVFLKGFRYVTNMSNAGDSRPKGIDRGVAMVPKNY